MTERELQSQYFEWLCQLIIWNKRYSEVLSYHKLLWRLYTTDFISIVHFDENRADDGIDLRYRFGRENNIADAIIAGALDNRPCSVLEMMVALAVRCEIHITDDPDLGNRTGRWFWSMISNLGLDSMNNNTYDEPYVDEVIARFLHRQYKPNGRGGLFTIKNCPDDMREVEIWYQLCWYLNDILGE